MSRRKKILVAPLNWGLGHASRCIPIIRELLKQDTEVLIASDGRSLDLLRKEFPQLEFYSLKGYKIKYHKNLSLPFSILLQIPKLIRAISSENKELRKIIREKKIDAVISDNRYGLHSRKIPCVFITHQIGIIMPSSLKWLEGIIYRRNKSLIGKFTECWTPDYEGEKNLPSGRQVLSGILSHKYSLPKNSKFIGPLSRFEMKNEVQKEYDILAILPGPEPQRTILENLLTEQLKQTSLKALIVSGTPEQTEIKKVTEHLSVTPFLNAEQLNKAILASEIIIARSGYSTIMDLAALGKNAILIPTPGQTEQEYLADYFFERKIFYSEKQKDFNLQRALKQSENYSGMKIGEKNNLLQEKIRELLNRIS